MSNLYAKNVLYIFKISKLHELGPAQVSPGEVGLAQSTNPTDQ